MAEDPTRMPVKTEDKTVESGSALPAWRPLETLRREVDRLFESFDPDFWRLPFRRGSFDIEPFLATAADLGCYPRCRYCREGQRLRSRCRRAGL